MSQQQMTGRLRSLDAFRGLAIAGMILVNSPGSWSHVYPPLLHAEWHGWTPTDLIFPFFLFIVGVSMAFSLTRRLERGSSVSVYRKILWRSFVIFGLGIFLNLFPAFDFASLRVAGVLQRIAVVYLVASLILLHASVFVQAMVALGILVFYWIVMTWVPVPGVGAGIWTPEGNLAAYVDRILLPGRMWNVTWDPEGLVSTIPAVSTTLFGALTGAWLRSGREKKEIAGWLFVFGWLGVVAGLFWGIWFPINKGIWTSSFVLFTAGAALHFLGLCYWLIEVKGYRRWAYPAIVYGMNAIAVYVLSGIVTDLLFAISLSHGEVETSLYTWIYLTFFASWAGPVRGSLLFAITYVGIWFVIMDWFFYRRGLFIKV